MHRGKKERTGCADNQKPRSIQLQNYLGAAVVFRRILQRRFDYQLVK